MNNKKLTAGNRVAIVSLSSGILGEPFIKHELDLGIKRLKELNLEPVFMKNSLLGIEKLKENPKLRADDLKQAFADKSINAILSAIGGNDAYKLIPYIFGDEDTIKTIRSNPKIFMGYSDTTTIHLMLNKLGINTFYGPAFVTDFAEFENEMLPYTRESINYLFNAPSEYKIESSKYWYKERTDFSPAAVGTPREKFKENNGYELICGDGKVSGEIRGGCLDILSSLAISASMPKQATLTKYLSLHFIKSTKLSPSSKNSLIERLKSFPVPAGIQATLFFVLYMALITLFNIPSPPTA